ncbi:MAG: uroporphyrinogen-III synthase [Sideroxydans sp.]|nr:uroporphyrinogen-III synthase [Sideroxydans sp.]
MSNVAHSSPATAQPLRGLSVLVTRPKAQAQSLAQAINALGGRAILLPLLDIAAVENPAHLQQQLARLAEFDLAIFISPNAVQYGMQAIRAAHANLPQHVACIGASSAQSLRDFGVANVIVPSLQSDSEALLALPELRDMQGQRVMILRGDGGRELLGDTLKARGAMVEYASCYQRSAAVVTTSDLLRDPPAVITITSSEALIYLRTLLDSHPALLATPLLVPHARIANLAKQQGWQNVTLTDAGDAGLVAALMNWRDLKGMI